MEEKMEAHREELKDKLKVLDDIKFSTTYENCRLAIGLEVVKVEDIRDLVINWIVYLETFGCFDSKMSDCKTATIGLRKAFNINDEDLKE